MSTLRTASSIVASAVAALVGAAAASTGCFVPDPLYCTQDSDCTDLSPQHICDETGALEASNQVARTCVVPDPDPEVDAGPGSPDEDAAGGCPATCVDDVLTWCPPASSETTTTTCALGCAEDGTRCADIDPSSGLAPYLDDPVRAGDVGISAGSTIDTTTGKVTRADGSLIDIPSTLHHQEHGPDILVFKVGTIAIDDVFVTGGPALAIVATGDIVVLGAIDATGGYNWKDGPGRPRNCGPGTYGVSTEQLRNRIPGGGGAGGFTSAGAAGGNNGAAPGGTGGRSDIAPLSDPLYGGCRGGLAFSYSLPVPLVAGGGGGGAVQLVSRTKIEVLTSSSAHGSINAGGGGGSGHGPEVSSGGGGAGGDILLEAPSVLVTGQLAANGGAGGGGCDQVGQSGSLGANPARGGNCTGSLVGDGGDGGTGLIAPKPGASLPGTQDGSYAGGGGGAAGRIRIKTADGSFTPRLAPSPPPLVSRAGRR